MRLRSIVTGSKFKGDEMTDDPKDYIPQNSYQDDIDTEGVDTITHEQTDSPVIDLSRADDDEEE